MKRLLFLSGLVALVVYAADGKGSGARTRIVPPANITGTAISPATVTATTGKFDVLDAGVLNVQGNAGVAGSLTVVGTSFGTTGKFNELDAGVIHIQSGATNALSIVGGAVMGSSTAGLVVNSSIGSSLYGYYLGSPLTLLDSTTAPTVSGFCTSPSVPASNGTAAFTINVGSACAGSTGTISLPTNTNGWVCDCHDVTTPASNYMEQTGGTTQTCTMQNYSRTLGTALAFTSSDVYRCTARGY